MSSGTSKTCKSIYSGNCPTQSIYLSIWYFASKYASSSLNNTSPLISCSLLKRLEIKTPFSSTNVGIWSIGANAFPLVTFTCKPKHNPLCFFASRIASLA